MTQEASFTFTTPLNLNVVEMKDGEHLFVEGDISTNDIDFVNDIMTKDCQKSMQKQILDRNMKLDLEHEAFKGDSHEEKEVNKTKIPAGKIIDATIKDLGKGRFATRVKCEINRHNPNYKLIKGNLVEKYLDAFSVAFLPTDISNEQREGKSIRMLNDVILLNVAMTGNPCNTKAQMAEVFVKSMDALEEYKKRKAEDPTIEGMLEVKNMNKKCQALYSVTDKLYGNTKLTPKELKLLKAALDVAENKGAAKELEKELMEKISAGIKLNNKEMMLLNSLLEVKNQMEMALCESACKSHSTANAEDITKLHKKNSKMTEEENDKETETDEGSNAEEGESSDDVEAKSVEMLKSISNELKSMNEKYDVVAKDNVAMKEELSKITLALKQPVHKSLNTNTKEDDDKKVEAEKKSVDPLELC